jgi:g-D-glutamyl-meso-diaminopimelate peptidase
MKMLEIREYSYVEMQKDIRFLLKQYPFLKIAKIGRSVLGRSIFALSLGATSARRRVHFNAGHHGMEWMTSWVLMNFISDLCKAVKTGERLYGNDVGLFFVPMVNPDGIQFALSGERWQANANGVDINHNYPANWQQCYPVPGSTRFGGHRPASEPETRAMMNFTGVMDFSRVFALHSQGEEIFWNFGEIHVPGARELADKMAEVSEYEVSTPEPMASYGGYKDWFIQEFRRPGFTLELGKGENPLDISEFEGVYERAMPMFMTGVVG